MGLIIRILLNAAALIVVAKFVPGVDVTGYVGAIVGAIVLGIVNAVIRPILILLSLPLEIVTLGLFTFIINAALFWFVGHLNLGLRVHGFGAALIGSIVLAVISWLIALIIAPARRDAVGR